LDVDNSHFPSLPERLEGWEMVSGERCRFVSSVLE
jgi:hypothetical protein